MGKYDKYVFPIPKPPMKNSLGNCEFELLTYDRESDPNCVFRMEVVQMDHVGAGSGFGTPMMDPSTGEVRGQWPHAHCVDEIYMFVGTNPEDVWDLGGTLEIWLGEGEDAEKFLIDRPTAIHIPAGLVHMPWVIRELHRNFLMIAMPMCPQLNDSYVAVNNLPPSIEEPDWCKDFEKIMK